MSTISAGTSGGTALVQSGDTTGQLVLQTNGTTTAVTIGTNQVVTLAQPLPVASGGTGGSATPTAGGVVYGTGSVQAVTAAGTAGQYLQSNGASAPTWAAVSAGFTLGTPVTPSTGVIDFTGIPAGVKQLVVTFRDIYLSGSDSIVIKLGVAGPTYPNAYQCMAVSFSSSGFNYTQYSNSGFNLLIEYNNANMNGQYIFTLLDSTNNYWVGTGISVNPGTDNKSSFSSGRSNLTGPLAAVQIRTRLGQTYTAGTINIAYI